MAKKKETTQQADVQSEESNLPVPHLPLIVETVGRSVEPSYSTAKQEYDVTQHDVFKEAIDKRPKKKKKDGTYQEVNRIGIPFQKLIVDRRVSFMNVGKIQLEANPKDETEQRLYDMVKFIRDDNMIELIEKEVARRMLYELQVAKLWYSQPVESGYYGDLVKKGGRFRMRCKILSPELGDTLLPVFDDYGKLIYFGRLYEATRSYSDLVGSADLINGYGDNKDQRFDIYSSTHIYKFRQARAGETIVSTTGNNNGWIIESVKPHSYGKIPVTYYSKPTPPWADVQSAIARLETVISNFADTNDYHASPTLVFIGNVKAEMLKKGETGKAVEIKPVGNDSKADVKYVTWEHAPESIKLEIEQLTQFIFTCTRTPQMSKEDMKGLGSLSGVAFDRVFMDAHQAAQDEIDGEYGRGTQRDINLQIAFAAAIDTTLSVAAKSMQIKYDIPLYRINDDAETVSLLQKASGGAKILSQRTAIEYSPLTKNSDDELKLIEQEQKAQDERNKANESNQEI
ncbi:phage portal protein [Olivibacter sp. 47]|uniref:phage portal protein n=1 Tax=Olivibacter sp. 47 TaxID=3056486 RepID=UPI0025A493D1|nr:phage portal protein [Olivibacter sp. 47]MDM8174778.1 phage portal protein [Olivibacter sp. 47]